MPPPHQVLPNRFWMLTRRTVEQQFFMRPDPEMNNAFIYCLAVAAERFSIDIILPQQMSNHHHTNFFDRLGNKHEFTEHFHKLLSKCGNAMRGRWDYFWNNAGPSYVELADRAAVVDKVVYAATNPVKDQLVDRVDHWPATNTLSALLNQREITARRPRHFFAEPGTMPEVATLRLVVPAELGEPDEFRREVRDRVADVEAVHAAQRLQTGRHVVGRRRILRESWRSSPDRPAPRRALKPRVATRDADTRIEILQRYRDFVIAYRKARQAWLAGTPIPFPIGTYWLRRFVNVPIAIAQN